MINVVGYVFDSELTIITGVDGDLNFIDPCKLVMRADVKNKMGVSVEPLLPFSRDGIGQTLQPISFLMAFSPEPSLVETYVEVVSKLRAIRNGDPVSGAKEMVYKEGDG